MLLPRLCEKPWCIAYTFTPNATVCAVHVQHPHYRAEADKSNVNWNEPMFTLPVEELQKRLNRWDT